MRASLLVAAAILAFGALVVSAQAPPPFPLAGGNGKLQMCRLDDLKLNGGLSILGQFSPSTFNYKCSCLDWSKIGYGAGSPTLELHTMDAGSNGQVWFNGEPIHTGDLNNALVNKGQQNAVSVPLASQANQWKVGNNLIQILVGCDVMDEMGNRICEYEYTITCNRPPADGGFVTGDPQFVGLRGQNYQVHGVAGEVYNIVSDADLQYNSRFVFLNKGECPVVNGKKQHGCFSHPGSYLGELGLKSASGEQVHIVSGSAKRGFAQVTVAGKELGIGETVMLASDAGSVSRNSTHVTSVQIGNWDFVFENSDMFINQRVRVLDARTLHAHGLLGQTWRDTTYPNSIKYVMGHVDDYVIRDGKIFGDNFLYNTYN